MSDAPTQPVTAPPGLPYGNRQQLEQAQRAQPVAGSALSSAVNGTPGANPGRLGPGEVPSLEDPSAYPDEPVTAGLDIGAGPGSDSTLTRPYGPESLSLLRAIYAIYRDEDVRRLIEQTELGL